MNATAGLILAILIFAAAMFMLGQIIPGILMVAKVLVVFLVVVLGIVVPVQAASLKLAVRAIFREDVPFKASYVLMAILLFVFVVVMMITTKM